jgi:hypothetical protein
MWVLEAKAIFSEGESGLVSEAQAKLDEAVLLSAQPDLESQTNAKALLSESILLFQQSEAVVKTSVYNSADFIFNREQVGLLLNAAGISGLAEQQAVEMIGKADPKRQLQILRVTDGNSEYYRALIVVSFSLDVNILADSNAGDSVMQVLEVVPKEFAEYASELDSNVSFDVLFDDPKLSFLLTRDDYRKKSFSYAFKNNLSQLQADALISGNVVNKFVAPPIFLPVGTVATGFSVSFDFMVYAAVAILIIVVVLVAILFLKRMHRGSGGFSSKGRFVSGGLQSVPGPKAKKQKDKPKGGKGFFSGAKLPRLGGKKNESPLSVFGKK